MCFAIHISSHWHITQIQLSNNVVYMQSLTWDVVSYHCYPCLFNLSPIVLTEKGSTWHKRWLKGTNSTFIPTYHFHLTYLLSSLKFPAWLYLGHYTTNIVLVHCITHQNINCHNLLALISRFSYIYALYFNYLIVVGFSYLVPDFHNQYYLVLCYQLATSLLETEVGRIYHLRSAQFPNGLNLCPLANWAMSTVYIRAIILCSVAYCMVCLRRTT